MSVASGGPDEPRTALVTGGSDGIGKEIARQLARTGVRVLLIGRDREKGARTERELREAAGNADVEFLAGDLSLMRDVSRLAEIVAGRVGALHYLVLNAGVVLGRRELTAEGIETQFALNYLSRFALAGQLLPLLRAGKASRILLIGGAARGGTIYFDDVNLAAKYSTVRAIRQLCEAQDVFTVALARRLSARDDHGINIACLKVGVVKTSIRRTFPAWMKTIVPVLIDPILAQTPQQVAESTRRLLLTDEFEWTTAALFLQIRKLRQLTPSARTVDPAAASRLWALSERMSGVTYPTWVEAPAA